MKRSWLITSFLIALLLIISQNASAQLNLPSLVPKVDAGTINGAPYTIIIPINWNGKLIVYTHGYKLRKTNIYTPPEDRNAYPSMSPGENQALPDMESYFLLKGYAIAGSAYKINGLNIKEGPEDTLALTRYFIGKYGKPSRTMLLGFSQGGYIAERLLEGAGDPNDRNPPLLYDGAVTCNGLLTGLPLYAGFAVDFLLAYDVAFGMPAEWGTVRDVNPNVSFYGQVVPQLALHLANPTEFGKLEFLRLVTREPLSNFYPGGNPNVNDTCALLYMSAVSTEARAEAENRAGGRIVYNVNHYYTLTNQEKDYLRSLGVDPDPLLNTMNARRDIVPDPIAVEYMANYGTINGKINAPLITVHNPGDGIVLASAETVLKELVDHSGRSHNLYQAYRTGYGHFDSTQTQVGTAMEALEKWLNTGVKPTQNDFPANKGFIPGYDPGEWLNPTH